jgi:5-methylcytosine-specific restriction endonuclease McrA
MRKIPKPVITPSDAYNDCYSSTQDTTRRSRYASICDYIRDVGNIYDERAHTNNLHIFKPELIVYHPVSNKDMITLYENNMLKNKAGRQIYDKLLALAPLSRCPFCGVGQASTLDHYLPKDKFPSFSVLPYNLVACCKDCNTGKSTSYATSKNTQALHPYYDNFTQAQWLYARVLQPLKIEFYVSPPLDWDQIDRDRVKAHFDNYKLADKFSNEASNALADLRGEFELFSTSPSDIEKELQKQFISHQKRYKNSWETAMYQALYKDSWYCNDGFKTAVL